jgi:flagellar hook-length control protein FliK
MLDSKNLLLDLGRTPKSDKAGSVDQSNEASRENLGQFAQVFGDAAANLKAAKSGKDLPLSADSPDIAATDASIASAESLFFSRTLKGGTELIVGGDEPSDEGLIAFARSQGMDPQALGLLTPANDDTGALSRPAALDLPQQLTGDNALSQEPGLDYQAPSLVAPQASATILPSPESLSGKALMAHAGDVNVLTAAAIEAGPATQEPAKAGFQAAIPSEKFLTDGRRLVAAHQGPVMADGEAAKVPASTQAGLQAAFPSENYFADRQRLAAAHQGPVVADGEAAKVPVNVQSGQIQNLQATALRQPREGLPTGRSPDIGIVKKNLHIKAETPLSNGKLAAADVQTIGAQVSQPEAGKMTVGRKVAEAFVKMHANRQHLPPTKLDAISLVDSKGTTVSAVIPPTAAPIVAAAVFVEGNVSNAAANTSLSAELASEPSEEDSARDVMRRQDDYTQMSRQLAEALGKRLTAQIQQGSWRVEMDLHPRSLGRVEVQLEMKNGELEAHFVAANATTRDLINEGMPRLREAFQEYGTETAYVDVGLANQGGSDGKSTASENGAGAVSAEQSADTEGESGSKSFNNLDDGLDILV